MADFPIPVIPASRPTLDRAFGSPKPEVRPTTTVKPVEKSDSEPDEPDPDQPGHELDLDA